MTNRPSRTNNRRQFLKSTSIVGLSALSPAILAGCDISGSKKDVPIVPAKDALPSSSGPTGIAGLGPLKPPDENGLLLPNGFTSRIVAVSGTTPSSSSDYIWHKSPDGGAVFHDPNGWVYVSNSESSSSGGVGAIRFDNKGAIVDAYSICQSTRRNCAGGKTPWDTWLTCEEVGDGWVYECDPLGKQAAIKWPLLGCFNHEAVAVDPNTNQLYLTEDRRDGCLYRFTPTNATNNRPDLSDGTLEVAAGSSDHLVWREITDPTLAASTELRFQIPDAVRFNGGEGIDYHDGAIFFGTKGDDRVWKIDIESQKLSIVYDRSTHANPILSGIDNIEITSAGDLVVAEDGGNMELVGIADGQVSVIVKVSGQDDSEIAGPAFSDDMTRLYFSSQRGMTGDGWDGITYEIAGPFSGVSA